MGVAYVLLIIINVRRTPMKRAYLYEVLASGTDAGQITITPPGVITRAINTITCDNIGIEEHPTITN